VKARPEGPARKLQHHRALNPRTADVTESFLNLGMSGLSAYPTIKMPDNWPSDWQAPVKTLLTSVPNAAFL
jgi:hypothetical protein